MTCFSIQNVIFLRFLEPRRMFIMLVNYDAQNITRILLKPDHCPRFCNVWTIIIILVHLEVE